VFTEDLVRKFTWINFFGTWDFRARKGVKKPIFILNGCVLMDEDRIVACGRRTILFLDKGYLKSPRGSIPIKRVVLFKGGQLSEMMVNKRGLVAEVVEKGGRVWVYLMEDQPFNSMFNQMYILRNYHNSLIPFLNWFTMTFPPWWSIGLEAAMNLNRRLQAEAQALSLSIPGVQVAGGCFLGYR